MEPDFSWITNELMDAIRFAETSNYSKPWIGQDTMIPEDQREGMISYKRNKDQEKILDAGGNPIPIAIGPYGIKISNLGGMIDSKDPTRDLSHRGAAGYGTPVISEEGAWTEPLARAWSRAFLRGIQTSYPEWNQRQVLQAYNLGPKGFRDHLNDPENVFLPPETINYPDRVFSSLVPSLTEDTTMMPVDYEKIGQQVTNTLLGNMPFPTNVPPPPPRPDSFIPIATPEDVPYLTDNLTTDRAIEGYLTAKIPADALPDKLLRWIKRISDGPELKGLSYGQKLKVILGEVRNEMMKGNFPEHLTYEGVPVGFHQGTESVPDRYHMPISPGQYQTIAGGGPQQAMPMPQKPGFPNWMQPYQPNVMQPQPAIMDPYNDPQKAAVIEHRRPERMPVMGGKGGPARPDMLMGSEPNRFTGGLQKFNDGSPHVELPKQYLEERFGGDIVPSLLTPGEAVIPKETAQDPVYKPVIKEMIAVGRARQDMKDANVMPIQGFNEGTAGALPWWRRVLQDEQNIINNVTPENWQDVLKGYQNDIGTIDNRMPTVNVEEAGDAIEQYNLSQNPLPMLPIEDDINYNNNLFNNNVEENNLERAIKGLPNLLPHEPGRRATYADNILGTPGFNVDNMLPPEYYSGDQKKLDVIKEEIPHAEEFSESFTEELDGNQVEYDGKNDHLRIVGKNPQEIDFAFKDNPEGEDNPKGLFQKMLDLFGFTKQDAARALLFYVGGRLSGGSHGGSLRWAGKQIVAEQAARGKATASARSSSASTMNSLRTYYGKNKKRWMRKGQKLLEQALATNDPNIFNQALAVVEAEYLEPLSRVADTSESPTKVRRSDGTKVIEAYPSLDNRSVLIASDGRGGYHQIVLGEGSEWELASADTTDNLLDELQKSASAMAGSKDTDSMLSKYAEAFNDEKLKNKDFFARTLESWANRHGINNLAMARDYLPAITTAVYQGLIPENTTLGGFLSMMTYKKTDLSTPAKITFKVGNAGDAFIFKLKEDIPNINTIMKTTDDFLSSRKIEIPAGREDPGPVYKQIYDLIQNSATFKQLPNEKKVNIMSIADEMNPYMAMLYLMKEMEDISNRK